MKATAASAAAKVKIKKEKYWPKKELVKIENSRNRKEILILIISINTIKNIRFWPLIAKPKKPKKIQKLHNNTNTE